MTTRGTCACSRHRARRLASCATWTSAEEDWVVAVFVNNVLDEIGIRQIDRTTEGSNWLRKGSTTDPRLYGLEVRYKFMP